MSNLLQEKFCEKYIPVTESGCWLWEGHIDEKGYGRYGNLRAHRIAYILYRGGIPNDMTVDHLCRVRCCVNPLHMEIVDNKENVLRGIGITATNAKKTHCKWGHPLSGDNLGIKKLGRFCIYCNNHSHERRRDRE